MTTTISRTLSRTWLRRVTPVLLLAGLACAPAPEAELVPRSTLLIGVDVSESFQRRGFDDALAFASRYIHAHLNGLGELEQPRALFVGAIGGEKPGEPQAFHPIHDFEGKNPAQIEADLRTWFRPNDTFTDFNAFFRRAAGLVKRQNLVLAPVTILLLTDGIPDVGSGQRMAVDDPDRFTAIDLDPLEYLARNVTVRILYPDPPVAVGWEREVPRDRVRMWTVDAVVMAGWRDQLRTVTPGPDPRTVTTASIGTVPGASADAADGGDARARQGGSDAEPVFGIEQPDLWRWISDNVDFRVRRSML